MSSGGGQLATLAYDAAQRFGPGTAATASGRSFSFTEIDALAGRLAGSLIARGLGRGDRIVLHLANGWEWIVCYHAIARIGGVVVPANILLTSAEISFMAAHAEASAVIAPPDRTLAAGARAMSIAVTEHGGDLQAMLEGAWTAPTTVAPDDLLAIGYTSGTTGRPKGAMLTHGNVHASIAMTATTHVRTAADRVFSALPLPHVYGNVVMNACFLSGGHLFTAPRFDAGRAIATIERERITLFEGVPTMFYQLLGHPALATADLSSLTRCTVGGQTMPTDKLDAAAERLGCPVLELWGMTEVAGPATSHSPYWTPRHGSIGLPFPGLMVRIADQHAPNLDAGIGERGELMVRGSLVTPGYWRDPEATAAVKDKDGWLATGDIAYRDSDGYLTIVDRKKDMILTAGYNVYPAELEQVISSYPGVAMVAVCGMPDPDKGELACAFVVPDLGVDIDLAGLDAHCRRHLAAYKLPRRVELVSDLPKTSTGKIMRRALRPSAALHASPAAQGAST